MQSRALRETRAGELAALTLMSYKAGVGLEAKQVLALRAIKASYYMQATISLVMECVMTLMMKAALIIQEWTVMMKKII
jgi:hypothetical protein